MKNKPEAVAAVPIKDGMHVDGESPGAVQTPLPVVATASLHKVPPKVPRTDLAAAPDTAMRQDFPPEPSFTSVEEQRALLQEACIHFPEFRADGPPIAFHFDKPPAHPAHNVKRKASDASAQQDAGHPAKVAKKVPQDPHEQLQRQLEEEERKAKKFQQKADREQAKLNTTLKKEEERRMREADRERLRMEKEAMKCVLTHCSHAASKELCPARQLITAEVSLCVVSA